MADQTHDSSNGRPHFATGAIGDGLNRMSDLEYRAVRERWSENELSTEMTFEDYVRESDIGLREQARYDEAGATDAAQAATRELSLPSAPNDRGRPTQAPTARPVRSETPASELSDDSLYRSPSPRRSDPLESFRNHQQGPSRSNAEDQDEPVRPSRTSTVHAVTSANFETDALDDEALMRLLANPPPEMLHQTSANFQPDPHQADALDDEGLARLLANPPQEMLERPAPIPGALDDEGLERLLAQQQKEIYEGGWQNLIKEAPSADHLSEEDLERFLASERDKLYSGDTDAFPTAQPHPDALDDEGLAKIIASLGFERRPLVQSERGEPSRSRPAAAPYQRQSSSTGAHLRPPIPPGEQPPTYSFDTTTETSPATQQVLSSKPASDAERMYREQLEERRRRQEAIQRRRDNGAERTEQSGSVQRGKQPERYYE